MIDEWDFKTVKIPVTIVQGRVVYSYGGSLPKLKEGTIGDLVVPECAVLEESRRAVLSGEKRVELLAADTTVRIAVKEPPPNHRLPSLDTIYSPSATVHQYVEARLQEPLFLVLRGTKRAVLRHCKCAIALLDREAISLNHAYTVASSEFEKNRKSHTGNVFRRVYVERDRGSWVPLEFLRQAAEASFEQERLARRAETAEQSTPE